MRCAAGVHAHVASAQLRVTRALNVARAMRGPVRTPARGGADHHGPSVPPAYEQKIDVHEAPAVYRHLGTAMGASAVSRYVVLRN